jgi:hypothetical protein
MSFNIEVEGGSSVRLPAAGKYCDRDIVVTATGGTEAVLLIQGKLTEWDIPDGVESIQAYAFYNNKGLLRVSVPHSVKTIGDHAFYQASKVHTLVLGDGLTELPKDGFGFMTSLKNITFPKNLESIGNYCFRAANGLTELRLPENLKSIGMNGFWECRGLKTVRFPASLKAIGASAFHSNTALVKAEFDGTPETIGANCFFSCAYLSTIAFKSGKSVCALSDSNALQSTSIAKGTGYIYVPAELVEQYKAAANWSTYASQIRAIEDYPDITGG